MKKIFTFLVFSLLISFSSYAQQAQGCDGIRYIDTVFTNIIDTSVVYGANVGVNGNPINLGMTIYMPEGDVQEKRPCIVFAHGGSFIAGDRSLMNPYCIDFAKKGYVTATISYRLLPLINVLTADSLDMMDIAMKAMGDMKAAVRYLRQDAATNNKFNIDPDHIFVGGLSAGAIMALHLAMLDENEDVPDYLVDIVEANGGWEGSSGDSLNMTFSSKAQATISMSGALFKEEWVGTNDPPVMSMHGDDDGTVPYAQGLAASIVYMNAGSSVIHARADQIGLPNYFVSVPGGGHTDIYSNPAFATYFEDFINTGSGFLEDVLCESSTSIEDVMQLPEATFAPNPASTNLKIDVANYDESYSVSLLDGLGRVVQVYNNVSSSSLSLDVSDLNRGMYLVKIVDDKNPRQQLTSKLIIQ